MTDHDPALPLVFTEAHRVFFLAAGIFAVLAGAVWTAWLAAYAVGEDVARLPIAQVPQLWHAHEMIFGYVGAVLAGFFLTAVPNWTKCEPPQSGFLLVLAAVWTGGRIAVWASAALPAWLVAGLDLAFLPALAAWVLSALRSNPKPANMMLLGVMAMLWFGNVLVHLDSIAGAGVGAGAGLRGGLLAEAALVVIVGGRVTPAFTRNAMQRVGAEGPLPQTLPFVGPLTIGAALALPMLTFGGIHGLGLGVPAALAALGQALRLAGWRGWWTREQPILWSLHLAGAALAMGYALLALAAFGWANELAALHLIGIGGVGGMTLAVMSRAALGHSGRPLVAPRALTGSYVMLALSALIRAVASSGSGTWYWSAVVSAGLLWCAAFALFVACYAPILAGPSLSEAAK